METDTATPIPVERVYQTLEAALSWNNDTRSTAEAQLRAWESDAAPGFIGSLLKVVAEVAAVPEVRVGRGLGVIACIVRGAKAVGGGAGGPAPPLPTSRRRNRQRSRLQGVQRAEQQGLHMNDRHIIHCALQEGRLMAAVVAKNAVGSSWRKTLGSREWSRVPGAWPASLSRQAGRQAASLCAAGLSRQLPVEQAPLNTCVAYIALH